MAGTAAITVEGVLKQEIGEGTIAQGLKMYHSLKAAFKIALITDLDLDLVNHWLRVNGLRDHAYIIGRNPVDPEDVRERRARQIGRLRGSNVQVDLVVVADPAVAAQAMSDGLVTLLFCHPQ